MTLTEWQKKTALPSLLLSLLFTLSFIVPIYWYPVDGTIKTLCTVINYGTWVLFAADYVYQIKIEDFYSSILTNTESLPEYLISA